MQPKYFCTINNSSTLKKKVCMQCASHEFMMGGSKCQPPPDFVSGHDELPLTQRVEWLLPQPDQMVADVDFAAAVVLCLLSSIMSSLRVPTGNSTLGKHTSAYENTMA